MPDLQTARKEIERALITRAEADPEFRSRLLSNPKAALEQETGIRFEENVKIEVHEETPTHLHLVIPVAIGIDGELSDDHLESVAGGGGSGFPDPLAGANIPGPVTLGMQSSNLSLGESKLVISGPPASEGGLSLSGPTSGITMISLTGAQSKFRTISNQQQQSGPSTTPGGSAFSLGQSSK